MGGQIRPPYPYERISIKSCAHIDDLIGAFNESTAALVETMDDANDAMMRIEDLMNIETNADTLDALQDEYVRVSRVYVESMDAFRKEYDAALDALSTIRMELDEVDDRLIVPTGARDACTRRV